MCSPFATPMMRTPFDIHLAEARRLNRGHKYAKQLNKLNKQHKFALLRSTYGGHYDAEMRRSLLVDRLFLICEKLSSRPIARLDTKPLFTPNDRLKRCSNCKGKFILLQDTGELCCTQCGLLEAIFGAIFDLQCLYTNYKYQTRPKTRSTKNTTSATILIGPSRHTGLYWDIQEGHYCLTIKSPKQSIPSPSSKVTYQKEFPTPSSLTKFLTASCRKANNA